MPYSRKSFTDIRTLQRMSGKLRKDRIKNKVVRHN